MATVYRKQFTKPLPQGAELFTRNATQFARWTVKGRKRTGEVRGEVDGLRIVQLASTYTAKYRTAAGLVVETPTKCRDEVAARSVLNELVKRVERVKGKVLTNAEDAVSNYADSPFAEHVEAYCTTLRAKRLTDGRVSLSRTRLLRLATLSGIKRLTDASAAKVESWLSAQADAGMAAQTRNGWRGVWVAFGNWCVGNHRLLVNPFERVPTANVKVDRRKVRRSLTEGELSRLLLVARLRPLADYGRKSVAVEADATKPKRSNWTRSPLTFDTIQAAAERGRTALASRPDFIAELDHRGRERSLIYKTLVLTGLRKGELAAVTVGNVLLTEEQGYIVLNAADEKSRRGAELPLRSDLAADIRQWIADRLATIQAESRLRLGATIHARLPHNARLFDVPMGLVRIFDRDLIAAGIAKRDERNRTIDVHALRMTFGTHLSKAGVSLRTAQAAMRHSTPELTANVYTDPKLLDIAGAMESLPLLTLDLPQPQIAVATGTVGAPPMQPSLLAPTLAPTNYILCKSLTPGDKTNRITSGAIANASRSKTSGNDVRFQRVAIAGNGKGGVDLNGVEPITPALQRQCSAN